MDEQKKRRHGEVAALKPRMIELETVEKKSRKEIALMLGLTPSQVTKTLGAVRPYRGKRIAA